MAGANENGCDYGPFSRPPKAGEASAVRGNKLTSCITVVTLRHWPDSDSFDHYIPCIQTVIDCLMCISFVDSLMDLYARITASAIPRSPRRSPPNGHAQCALQSSTGWRHDRPIDGQQSRRAPELPDSNRLPDVRSAQEISVEVRRSKTPVREISVGVRRSKTLVREISVEVRRLKVSALGLIANLTRLPCASATALGIVDPQVLLGVYLEARVVFIPQW